MTTHSATQNLFGEPTHRLLRLSLIGDGVITSANGLAYLILGTVLDDLLGVPTGWLLGIGAFLTLWGAFVAITGTRNLQNAVPRALAWVAVVVNAVWAIDSVAAAALGWFDQTAVGAVWTILQAGVVLGFAALQYAGLRRSRREAAT